MSFVHAIVKHSQQTRHMAFLIKSKFDEWDVISLTHKATCHCTDPVSCNKLKAICYGN